MKRFLRWLRYPALVCTALLIAAGFANRVPKLPVPPEVTKRTEKLTLQGKDKPVDIYLPQNVGKAPVVIVSHGFTRHRRVMAGWGILLAQHDMIAVVPNLPFFADHVGNSHAIADLISLVHEPGRITNPVPNGDVALMGHSAGGFATLLAATHNKQARCWIGLDPVDFDHRGREAITALRIPSLMLVADSGAWNRWSNALTWLRVNGGPLLALHVRGSTHCDPEFPTSLLAEIACGDTDATRRAVYERYAVAMLRYVLFKDQGAHDVMTRHNNDPAVSLLPAEPFPDPAAKEE
ncbi:MAG: hypothetical protein U1F71_25940 [Verrucomicrobiaceae bacterium]